MERKPLIKVALAIVVKNAMSRPEVWLQARSESGPLAGFLEFPGGKMESYETPCETAVRELAEESSHAFDIRRARELGFYQHSYPDRRVELRAITFGLKDGESWQGVGGEWFLLESLVSDLRERVLDASRPILEDLQQQIREIKTVGKSLSHFGKGIY